MPSSYRRLKVLITNIWLANFAGTETVVRDIALGLSARGHFPIVYSPLLGKMGGLIASRGIPVIDDLAKLGEVPDVIHGQHYVTAGEAILAFPNTPAVFICHGWSDWLERPPKFPHLLYAAVSETCRDRIVQMEGIDAARTRILLNAVDVDRIPQRPHALSRPRPARALVFTNVSIHIAAVLAACAQLGIPLDILGMPGRVSHTPEEELVRYDIVFASGRCAIEALCAGCAVVVCDQNGLGGIVTAENYERLRQRNFGLRALTSAVSSDSIAREIQRYDASETESLAPLIRGEADLGIYLDRLEEFYGEAITGFQSNPPSPETFRQAARDFLHQTLPLHPGDSRWPWLKERDALTRRLETLVLDYANFHQSRSRLARALLTAIVKKFPRRARE